MSEKVQIKEMPSYLNMSCLQKALKKVCQTKCVKLEDSKWELANMSGVNNCSNIYRINGSYKIVETKNNDEMENVGKIQNFNFFAKDMILETAAADFETNEIIMFEKILPQMTSILESLQTEVTTETSNKLSANCYLTQLKKKEHEFYILEDLSVLGYKLGNRCEGLSGEEAKLVMEKLAKFHAASMVYAKKFPDIVANLLPCHFAESEVDPQSVALTKKCVECGMDVIETPLDEQLVEKIKKFSTEFHDKVKEHVKPSKNGFNVLNHGDLWVNNILLKESDEQKTKADVIFVDFQDVFWGSPAYDLLYILYENLSLNTLQTQRLELLLHYYKTLKALLEALNYKNIPTWSDLLKELKRNALIGFYVALCDFPFIVMSPEAAEGFTAKLFLESTTKWISIYRTSRVKAAITYAVFHFVETGLFDE